MSKVIAKKELKYVDGYLLDGSTVVNDRDIVTLFNAYAADMDRVKSAKAALEVFNAIKEEKKVTDVESLFDKYGPDIKAIEEMSERAQAKSKALNNLDGWIKAEAMYSLLVEWVNGDHVLIKSENLTTDKFTSNPLDTSITAESIVKDLAELVETTTESKEVNTAASKTLTI